MQVARSKLLLLALQMVYSLSEQILLAPVAPPPLQLLFSMLKKLPAFSSPGYR